MAIISKAPITQGRIKLDEYKTEGPKVVREKTGRIIGSWRSPVWLLIVVFEVVAIGLLLRKLI